MHYCPTVDNSDIIIILITTNHKNQARHTAQLNRHTDKTEKLTVTDKHIVHTLKYIIYQALDKSDEAVHDIILHDKVRVVTLI